MFNKVHETSLTFFVSTTEVWRNSGSGSHEDLSPERGWLRVPGESRYKTEETEPLSVKEDDRGLDPKIVPLPY